MAMSFAYGVFHAAGPGHGKAVISAYVLSSGESTLRGVLLSFASAFVQALSAILIVFIGSIMLRLTAQSMTLATRWIEVASYALITLLGGWLLISRLSGRGHHHHPHAHGDDGHPGHDHSHSSRDLARTKLRISSALTAVLAVGIRPCTGAIIILVFALSQGLLAAGVAATFIMALGTGLTVALLATLAVCARDVALQLAGGGAGISMAAKVVEILGGLAILTFGLLMLGGALAT